MRKAAVKHAGQATIADLAPMLDRIRALAGLREVKPGIFHRKS